MAYRTDTTPAAPSYEPSYEETQSPSTGRRWPGWAAVVASLAAAATLAVVVVAGNDDADTAPVRGVHSGLVEHGSIRAIEGTVEDADPLRRPRSGLIDHGSVRSIEGPVEDTAPAGNPRSAPER